MSVVEIEDTVQENTNYRSVLYTDEFQQIVLYSVNVGKGVRGGHDTASLALRVDQGDAAVSLDGRHFDATVGDLVIVPPGVDYDITSTGIEALKMLGIFSGEAPFAANEVVAAAPSSSRRK